jgi:hypothetical protein
MIRRDRWQHWRSAPAHVALLAVQYGVWPPRSLGLVWRRFRLIERWYAHNAAHS